MANQVHVVPSPGGGWDVKRPGTSTSVHRSTQEEAEDLARAILRHIGGGELLIHARDGSIRAKDTIAPGNDPYPPKG